MTNDRLYWTDENWAKYLRCPIKDVEEWRNILNANYDVCVELCKNDNMYHLRIYYKGQGLRLIAFSSQGFYSEQSAIMNANETIIPILSLNPLMSQKLGVPREALQMVLIKEK